MLITCFRFALGDLMVIWRLAIMIKVDMKPIQSIIQLNITVIKGTFMGSKYWMSWLAIKQSSLLDLLRRAKEHLLILDQQLLMPIQRSVPNFNHLSIVKHQTKLDVLHLQILKRDLNVTSTISQLIKLLMNSFPCFPLISFN